MQQRDAPDIKAVYHRFARTLWGPVAIGVLFAIALIVVPGWTSYGPIHPHEQRQLAYIDDPTNLAHVGAVVYDVGVGREVRFSGMADHHDADTLARSIDAQILGSDAYKALSEEGRALAIALGRVFGDEMMNQQAGLDAVFPGASLYEGHEEKDFLVDFREAYGAYEDDFPLGEVMVLQWAAGVEDRGALHDSMALRRWLIRLVCLVGLGGSIATLVVGIRAR